MILIIIKKIMVIKILNNKNISIKKLLQLI